MVNIFKFLKYIIPAILLIVIIYGYFWLKGFDVGRTDPSIATTDNNLFFLETKSLKSLAGDITTGNKIWEQLKAIPEISDLDSLIRQLGDLHFQDEKIRRLLLSKAFISINREAGDKIATVLIFQQTQKIPERIFSTALMETGKVEVINKRKYEGTTLFEVNFKKISGIKDISFTIKKGLVFCSFSSIQIEEAISAMAGRGRKEPVYNYSRLKRTASENVSANVFFEFSALDALLNLFTSDSNTNLKAFASSAGYDLETGSDYMVLNGFTAGSDSAADAIRIISGQTPSVMVLPDFIPASATMFIQLNFSEVSSFFRNQSSYSQWKPDEKKIAGLDQAYSNDTRGFFEGITGGEFGMVMLNHNNRPAWFFITEVKSGSSVEDHLKSWLKVWATTNNAKESDFYFFRKIDNQQGINIYRLPSGEIPEAVYGSLFKPVNGGFFSVYMNYLIFGNSADEIEEYIYQIILGRNISASENYKKIQNNLLSRANVFIYLNPYLTAGLLSGGMSNETLNFYRKYPKVLEKFNTLTVQVNSGDDLFYSRIFMQYSETVNEFVNTVWMSKMDSNCIIKPVIVTNHTNSEKEIMVQDAGNQLYLISNAGRIIWKAPLDGPLMSEVFQIDYFRNGRLQYLFNTKNKIYLIDRNGNAVDKYPVVLRSPATNGLALFDYDRNGDLRICIACENKRIYMYDRAGRVVSGWNPAATDYQIEKTIQHFRVDLKDYIIASDKNKTYIYDRQGRLRVNPVRQHPVSQNNPFFLDLSPGRENARIISTDTTGNILYIYFSGKTNIEKKEETDNNHYFVLSDLNGDGRFEQVYVSGKKLRVQGSNGTLIFEKLFESAVKHRPIIYEFSKNDRKIGIVVEGEEKIYLFNSDGSIYKGFPLKGSTFFSISNFPGLKAKFNLIVGNKDNFLYNYSVQ